MPNYDLSGGTGAPAGMSSLTTSVIGQVAGTAISSWNSYQLDRISFQMQRDVAKYQREAKAQSRRQQGWLYSRNKEKLKESMYSEKLAMDIDSMRQTASIQNSAVAANVSNASSVVRDARRQQLRAELYQDRAHLNQLEKLQVESLDSMRNDQIVYDPTAPSAGGAMLQFGVEALEIGQAAYKPFVPAQQ